MFVCLQLMWPDVWTKPLPWAAGSSPVWKTRPATPTGCMKSVNSSSTLLRPSTQRWVWQSVRPSLHPPVHLSVCLTWVCVFLSRVKPLWRKVCTASLRESHPRFSRLSAAATSSRGWSLRFVNSRLSITPRCSSLIVTHWVCVFCLVKGARRVLHQPRHLHCGSNQPWCHRRGGAGANSLPQQVRTHTCLTHRSHNNMGT